MLRDNEEGSTKLLMAGAITALVLFAGWLVFDITRPKPIQKPRMADWEVKAWKAIKCDHCGVAMDPFNPKDGFYPGSPDGRRKILCEKCGTNWLAMIAKAKKKGVRYAD